MDELFEFARSGYADPTSAASATFDSVMGYPRFIWRSPRMLYDGQSSTRIFALQPLRE